MPRERRRPCARCGKNRAERFFRTARSRICDTCKRGDSRRRSRDVRLGESYGITVAEYDLIFAAQEGRCAICRGIRPGNLDVDHDHAVERTLLGEGVPKPAATRRSIRGLLCRRCNRRLLPAAQDSPERLDAAKHYLTAGLETTQTLLGQ